MILWNGSTGGLGRCMGDGVREAGLAGGPLHARLEDTRALQTELDTMSRDARLTTGAVVWLVQMAAMVSVPGCERDPERAHQTNVLDTTATVRAFAEWAHARAVTPSLVYVSTGHVYAVQPSGHRLAERDALAPRSVYARTKAAAEGALAALAEELSMRLIVARVFGLIAPGQPRHYVLPALIDRARRRDVSAVQGASCVRDYLDARDVCACLVRLTRARDVAGIVNVCSGEGVSIRAMLERVLDLVHPSEAVELRAQVSEAPGRPDDVAWIVGDPTGLERAMGAPARTIPLAQTIAEAIARG